MKKFLLLAVGLCLAASAFAGPLTPNPTYTNVPALSPMRLSIGAGLDFAQFQKMGQTPLPDYTPHSAWQPGLFGAYVISENVSLTTSASLNTENHWLEWRFGFRVRVWNGAQ